MSSKEPTTDKCTLCNSEDNLIQSSLKAAFCETCLSLMSEGKDDEIAMRIVWE